MFQIQINFLCVSKVLYTWFYVYLETKMQKMKRVFNFVNTMRIGFYKIRDNGYVNRLIGICLNIWKENHNMSALYSGHSKNTIQPGTVSQRVLNSTLIPAIETE